jgi:hypothetical protein
MKIMKIKLLKKNVVYRYEKRKKNVYERFFEKKYENNNIYVTATLPHCHCHAATDSAIRPLPLPHCHCHPHFD